MLPSRRTKCELQFLSGYKCIYILYMAIYFLSFDMKLASILANVVHKNKKNTQRVPLFHGLTLNNGKWVILPI